MSASDRGPGLLGRAKERAGVLGAGAYALGLTVLVLAAVGTVGALVHEPWLFPSLGPTIMLIAESPEQISSSPRNTLIGHFVGILTGLVCLAAFGLVSSPPATTGGLTPRYVAAGALSVGLTTLLLTVLRSPHPPAGATTLLVSLGILAKPSDLVTIAAAVTAVTALGWSINRALGTRFPGGSPPS